MRQYIKPELEKLLLDKGCIPDGKHFDFLDCIRRESAVKIWGEERKCKVDMNISYRHMHSKRCQNSWQHHTLKLTDLYQSGGDWQQLLIDHLSVTIPPHL